MLAMAFFHFDILIQQVYITSITKYNVLESHIEWIKRVAS